MLKTNEKIILTFHEAIEVLKEIEVILISLHRMGSYYFCMDKDQEGYEKETTRFIDESMVTHRLAKVRKILSMKFDDTCGADEMDDIEREMQNLKYWKVPGDNLDEFVDIFDDECENE